MTQVSEEQLEEMEALFVQTAASMTSDGRTIKFLSFAEPGDRPPEDAVPRGCQA